MRLWIGFKTGSGKASPFENTGGSGGGPPGLSSSLITSYSPPRGALGG